MSNPDPTTSQPKPRPSKRRFSSFKLQGNTNFPQWDLALRNTLTGRGLLQYITKPTPRRPIPRLGPSSSTEAQQGATVKTSATPAEEDLLAKWRSDRARCTQIIMNSLSEKVIKTLLDNEPRAFEGCGNIKHTGFGDESDMPISNDEPADREAILDGTNPKSLYDLICECYPFTTQEAISSAWKEVEENLKGLEGWDERTLGEGMARFRFLKRSLNEVRRGKTEFGWNLVLKDVLHDYYVNRVSGQNFYAQAIDEILGGHREKRWMGEREENDDSDDGEEDGGNHNESQHESQGIKGQDENQDESEDEPLAVRRLRKREKHRDYGTSMDVCEDDEDSGLPPMD